MRQYKTVQKTYRNFPLVLIARESWGLKMCSWVTSSSLLARYHLHWEVCYPCSIPETTLASPRNMLLPGLIALNLPHLQKPGPWQPAISVIRRRKIMASSSVKLPTTSLFLWKHYYIVSRRFSYTKCVVSVVRTPNCRKDPYLFSLSPNVSCLVISVQLFIQLSSV